MLFDEEDFVVALAKTPCCPHVNIPSTIFATVTGCTCANSVSLTYTTNGGFRGGCSFIGQAGWYSNQLTCSGGTMAFAFFQGQSAPCTLNICCAGELLGVPRSSGSCDSVLNLTFVFNVASNNNLDVSCCGSTSITVHLTQ